ncbi:MAG: site-specific integrase, partial [Rhodospirillales bacterium]
MTLAPELTCDPALAAAASRWRDWLAHEKRYSPHTLAGYQHDLAGFLRFMADHLGGPPGLAEIEGLKPLDFRAWLADLNRRGLSRTSTARSLS